MGVLNTFTESRHSKVKYKFVFYQVSSPPSPSSLLKLPKKVVAVEPLALDGKTEHFTSRAPTIPPATQAILAP